jgi:hypothetical protein
MASRMWILRTSLMGALVLTMTACPLGTGDVVTTGVDSSIATSGFDESFEEDGGFTECLEYFEACETDPYCACYLECAGEGGQHFDCLAKCNLAQTPYWAEQLFLCLGTNLGSGQSSG